MGCLFSKSEGKVEKIPKNDEAPEEDHGSLSGGGGGGLTGAKSPRKPSTVFTSDGPKPVPKARMFIDDDDDSPIRPSGPSKVLKKRVPTRLAERPSNSAPDMDEVQDDLEAELAKAKPRKGAPAASASTTADPDAEAIAAEVEKLKRRKKDKSRLTDLDSDEEPEPGEVGGTREDALRKRAAQRTSTVGMSSGVRKTVFGELDDLSDDESSGQFMAPAVSSAPILGGPRPLLGGSGMGRLAPLKPLGGISDGPSLGSFLAPVRRPPGKSVPAVQEQPVSVYQQRQQEERQPSLAPISAPPPEKVDDDEDFVWKDDEDGPLAAPRPPVEDVEPAVSSLSQLEDDEEGDLVWRDDEEEEPSHPPPPQPAQPPSPPVVPDDEGDLVWRDDEDTTPSFTRPRDDPPTNARSPTPERDEYEDDVFETEETKPAATMLEEMIGETDRYAVEEDDEFEPDELPDLSSESPGVATPANAAKHEDSLVLEDATPVPFTPSSEPRPPEEDWGGDDIDDGFEAGGEIDYEDAAAVDEDESEDDVW